MGERERKKQQTRRNLADAAVRLFTEHGYDHVTMARVAAEAGVSRRTAFRYFASKDDLVMDYPLAWLRVFDDSIRDNRTLPVGQRVRRASHSIADFIESDPQAVRQLFALASSHPNLAARYASSSRNWIDRLALEIGHGVPDDHHQEVRMLAAAVMGVIDSVCEIWAEGDEAMGPLLDTGLAMLATAFTQIEEATPDRP